MHDLFKKTLVLLFGIFLILGVSGCGQLGFNEDKDIDDSLEETDDIQKAYRSVEGVYTGSMIVLDDGKPSELPVKLTLFTEITFGGRTQGELTPQTTLVGFFEVLNINTEMNYYRYTGRFYYRKDGRIQLAVRTGSASGSNQNPGSTGIWLEAKVKGNQIVDGRLHNDGLYGTFQVGRQTRDVQVPAKGRIEEERKRFEEVYRQAAGTYVGTISPPESGSPVGPQRVQFHFYLVRGLMRGVVTLAGSAQSPRILRVIQYRTDSGFIEIEGIPELSGTGGPQRGFGYFYAKGYLTSGELLLTEVEDHRGLLGTFEGTKQD
ncbi:MAG: hypothetical protein HRT45_14095 [Bdellovibrionales bacterium]|nr:hypothetical protein [Bdellovibrionales bacterium]